MGERFLGEMYEDEQGARVAGLEATRQPRVRKLQGQQGQAETEDQEIDRIAGCHPAPPTRPREGP